MTTIPIEELRKMKTATTFLHQSSYDYVAGRCLEINHFSSVALPLLAISIEKILKAIIALENKEFKPWQKKHGIKNLFYIVCEYKDYNISAFSDYSLKLEELYKLRYPDSIGPPEGVTIIDTDYNTIDSLYITLADQIKLPLEIKFRCGLHSIVFDEYDQRRRNKEWALKENNALKLILPKWTNEYKQYTKLLAEIEEFR